jgi:pimeloyl-ACP methyl ester carboxylesterase
LHFYSHSFHSLQASLAVVALAWALLPTSLANSYLFIELLFAFIIAPLKLASLSRSINQAPATANVKQGLSALHKLLDPNEIHADIVRDPEWFPSWFTESASLGLGNISQFLGYTFFANRAANDNACDFVRRVLEQTTRKFASIVGLTHLEDRDHTSPTADFIAHTEQPIKVAYRPLAFYVFTECVALWCHWKLTRSLGFKPLEHKSSIATYYLYQPTTATEETLPPIVFLHGIGLGLAPYLGFIDKLQKQHPCRSIYAVSYQHVSMRLSTTLLPTAAEVAEDIAAFLGSSGITKANIIGHSYGTLVASSLVKRHPALLSGLTLIDPVCFLMFLPYMTNRTFHFDTSKHVTALGSMMKGLVLRELHCAASMSKRFVWHEMNLWASDIPSDIKTTVVLGGSDDMVPASSIQKMLSSPAAKARGITLLHIDDMGHGGFLLDSDLQAKVAASEAIAGSPSAPTYAPVITMVNLHTAVKEPVDFLTPDVVMPLVGSLPSLAAESLHSLSSNIVPLSQPKSTTKRLTAATIMAQCSAIRAEAWCRGHAAAARLKEMTSRAGSKAQIRRM